jgi:hypothetical protein
MLFNRLNGKFQLTVNNRRRKTKLWITHKRDNRPEREPNPEEPRNLIVTGSGPTTEFMDLTGGRPNTLQGLAFCLAVNTDDIYYYELFPHLQKYHDQGYDVQWIVLILEEVLTTMNEDDAKLCRVTLGRIGQATEPLKTSGSQTNEICDWSRIIPCHACGAGNPCNPSSLRLTPTEIDMTLYNVGFQYQLPVSGKHSFKRKWRHRLEFFFLISLVLIVISSVLFALIQIVKNIDIIAATIPVALVVVLGVLALGFVWPLLGKGISYLIENAAIREARREEKYKERERKNKQIHLNKEVERITNVIKKKIEKNKPIENILPDIRTKDYEALAKTISTIDFIKDTDKGCLFKNMSPDFISKVLVYFSEANEIAILRQIEPEKRKGILFRCSLSKRNRIESILEKSEVSSQESNDSEGH